MSINYKSLALLSLFSSSLFSHYAQAGDSMFKFSGFANLGATYSNGDEFGFRSQLINKGRDGFSFAPDSLLGLQVNADLSNDFDFVGQVVIQDRTDNTFSNYLELAFLRYQINRNWSLKAGRFSTNSYLFTDFRYVGQASYWVRPPVEMYSTVGSLGNMDGAQVDYTVDTNLGFLKLSAAFGESKLNNDNDDGVFELSYQDLVVLNIELQSDNWKIQGAYLSARLDDFDFAEIDRVRAAPLLAPPLLSPIFEEIESALIPDDERVSYYSLSGKYNFEKFEITAEYGNYDGEWAFTPASRFGYVSLAYNHQTLMPFVTISRSKRDQEPGIIDLASLEQSLPAQLFDALSDSVQPANDVAIGSSVDQSSISLGLRWDIGSNWALKSQFDHFRIDEQGSGLFDVKNGNVSNDGETSYNVTSLSLSTTF